MNCDHQCTGNCRRVGCNCECGEFHDIPEHKLFSVIPSSKPAQKRTFPAIGKYKELVTWTILAGIVMASLLTIEHILTDLAYDNGFQACLLAQRIQ